jgi:hypothetical protein
MSSTQIALLAVLFSGFSVFFTGFSVIFAGRQTRLLAKSISELSQQTTLSRASAEAAITQTKLSTTFAVNSNYQALNRDMLSDPDLLNPYGK